MVETRLMFCDGCKKQVPITDVKYMPKGKDGRAALCKDCIAKLNPSSGPALFEAKAKETLKSKPIPPAGFDTESKISFICSKCKFKFKYDKSKISALRCPYCGSSDRLERVSDAHSIVTNSGY